MFRIITLALPCLAFSSLTIADEGEHKHHGHHGVAITEQSNVHIITREPRDTLHRHRDTAAMTSVPIRVWLVVL